MKDDSTAAFELALGALKERIADKPPLFIDVLYGPIHGSIAIKHIESAKSLAFGISEITMTDGKKIVCLEHISTLIHQLTRSLATLAEIERNENNS